MKTPGLARKVLTWLLIVGGILLALHLVFQYLNLSFDQKQGQVYEISNRLDMDDEVSVPTWFSQFLLISIALAAWLASRFEAHTGRRKAWRLIALIGLLFSIDEVGGAHEFVLQSAHLIYYGEVAPTSVLNAWWLILPVVAVAATWLLWWLWRILPKRTVWLFMLAGAIYLAGAIGFEVGGIDFNKASFGYQGLAIGVEEGLEMLGAIVALYAIIDYMETHLGGRLSGLRKALAKES